MPAQALGHERLAQTPPFQRRLHLASFDDFKPGRRAPAGSTPEPSGEPEFAQGDRERDHRQGRSLDRLDASARLAGDAQHHLLASGGLDRGQARRSRRPERLVHVRTRASAPPARSALPPDRDCSCRTIAPRDARTGTGIDMRFPSPASSALPRTADGDPSTPRDRRSAHHIEPPDADRRPARCLLAALAAYPALARSAPANRPGVRLGASLGWNKENVLAMFPSCGHRSRRRVDGLAHGCRPSFISR